MAYRVASRVSEKDLEREEFLIDILSVLELAKWRECCIYRIPKNLRKVNKEAYIPKLVSISPLHQCKRELRDMEKQKLRYFKEFCFRTGRTGRILHSSLERRKQKSVTVMQSPQDSEAESS